MNAIDWKEPVPRGLGERENKTRSMRWPGQLAHDVEQIAAARGQSFSNVALHLVEAAVAEYRRRHEKPSRRKVA